MEIATHSRRSVLKNVALATLTVAAAATVDLTLTGCNTSWIATALNDLPVAVALAGSFASIAGIVNPALTPVIIAAINQGATLAKAGLTEVQTLIASYKASPSATTLGKIDDTLTTLLGNLQSLLPSLNINDPAILSTATQALSGIIGIVSAVLLLIPPATSAKQVSPRRIQAHDAFAAKAVLPRAEAVKTQYNAVALLNGFPQLVIQ